MIGYFNKKGALIKRTEWNKRIRTRSYHAYKEYDNGDILVKADWHGVSDRELAPEDRKIFRLTVSNMVNGTWVKDISLTEDFANVANMLARYEDVLLQHTECELNDEFEFVEKGNLAEAIPVPKPKKVEPKPVFVGETMTKKKTEPETEIRLDEDLNTATPSTTSTTLGEWS